MKNLVAPAKAQQGLTLVELLIVIAIIGILSSIGILTFVQYNKRQVLINTANEVYSALSTAKSRAQTQIKPTECNTPGRTLYGYRVDIVLSSCYGGACYGLVPVCTGLPVVTAPYIKIPNGITFSQPTISTSYVFRVLTGSVVRSGGAMPLGGADITLSNDSNTITIKVYSDGNISKGEIQ